MQAQEKVDIDSELKGMCIRVDGNRDTLHFYLDGQGVDCGISGKNGLLHGYFLEIAEKTVEFEGLCSGKKRQMKYVLARKEGYLEVEDFYSETGKMLRFEKRKD